jgi:putative ABC transport system permease protein
LRAHRQTRDILAQTFQDLWAHKLRSFLTMFGIGWGMMSLLLLGSLGQGFREGQRRQMAQWGKDMIFVWGGNIKGAAGLTERWLNFTDDDCRLIQERCPLVRYCSPILRRGNLRLESAHNNAVFPVSGAWPNLAEIQFLPLASGRFVQDRDLQQGSRVAVLGERVYRQLFPSGLSAGGRLRIGEVPFEVVGVLQPIGKEARGGNNETVFIPLETMIRYFPHPRSGAYPRSVGQLVIQPVEAGVHKQAIEQYRQVLARKYGLDAQDKDAFDEWDTVANAERFEHLLHAMDIFLGSVGVVTLALGAIGVMNIMLVTVGERTHEIGMRKAIGATRRDILTLFLVEGVAIILLSGGAGILLGWGITKALLLAPRPEGFQPPTVTWRLTVEAFLLLGLAALGSCLAPARSAALLPPAEALRDEV